MLAVFINCVAVIIGSLLGLLFSSRISKNLSNVVTTASGITVCILGLQMAFKYQNVIYLALSLILGGVLGTIIDIDGKILSFGKFIERRFYHAKIFSEQQSSIESQVLDNRPNFAYAFLNASVLFCVGAMSILGSFQAGINNDYSIIFTKSVLDGFMAIVFASSMGIGTAFSAVAILVYQGALTLLSTFIAPYVSDSMIAELTGSGGALIVMIGINLIGLKKIKTADYLPAMIFSVIFVILDPVIKSIIKY